MVCKVPSTASPTVSQGFGFSLVSAVGVRPAVVLLLLFEEKEVSLFPKEH